MLPLISLAIPASSRGGGRELAAWRAAPAGAAEAANDRARRAAATGWLNLGWNRIIADLRASPKHLHQGAIRRRFGFILALLLAWFPPGTFAFRPSLAPWFSFGRCEPRASSPSSSRPWTQG